MSITPVSATNDASNDALFDTWLKPLQPTHPTADAVIVKIAPFRHQFLTAANRGYGWNQLAKEIATKPEIGVKVTGALLKRYVTEAYAQAGEPLPVARRKRRRPTAKPAKTASAAAQTTKPS